MPRGSKRWEEGAKGALSTYKVLFSTKKSFLNVVLVF